MKYDPEQWPVKDDGVVEYWAWPSVPKDIEELFAKWQPRMLAAFERLNDRLEGKESDERGSMEATGRGPGE